MAKIERDQTTRVYGAESACGIKRSEEELTLKQCQKFVDRVLARQYVKKNYGSYRIIVRDGRGQRRATASWYYGQRVINLPKWARNEFVILHEISHHLDTGRYTHGALFATIMLDLVRNVMGKEKADQLQSGYALKGVKVIGANQKRVKARCPKSRKEWLTTEKNRRRQIVACLVKVEPTRLKF